MAATFEGVASGVEDTPVSSFNVDYPSGTVEGDLIIVCITRDAGSAFSLPAGWTNQGNLGTSSAVIYSRYAPASPGSNFPVSMTATGDVAWISYRFSGAAESTIALGAADSNSSRPPEIAPGAQVTPTGGPDLFWLQFAVGTGAISLTGYPTDYPNGRAVESFSGPLFSRNQDLGGCVSNLTSTKPSADEWTSTGNDQWYCRGLYLMPVIEPTGFAVANDVETPVFTPAHVIDPPDDPVVPPSIDPPAVATGGGLKWSPGCTCCFLCPPVSCPNADLSLTQASMTVEGFPASNVTKEAHCHPIGVGIGLSPTIEPIGKWIFTWKNFNLLNHTISTNINSITNAACATKANASCPNLFMENKVTNLGQVTIEGKYEDLSPASSWGTCSNTGVASMTFDVYSCLGLYTITPGTGVPVAVSNAVNSCGVPLNNPEISGYQQRYDLFFLLNNEVPINEVDGATGPNCPGTNGSPSWDPLYNDVNARFSAGLAATPYHFVAGSNAIINTSTNLIDSLYDRVSNQFFLHSTCFDGFGANRKRTLVSAAAAGLLGTPQDGGFGFDSYGQYYLGIPSVANYGAGPSIFFPHNFRANCPGDHRFDCSDPDNYSEYEADEHAVGWREVAVGSSYVSGPRCYWTFA